MEVAWIPSPRRAPLLWAAWALALFALTRLACSFSPTTPLAALPGFQEAAQSLVDAQGPDSIVVVWPPELSAALYALPAELRATDAPPIENSAARQYTRLFVLGPVGGATPPELADATLEGRKRFDDVEIVTVTYPTTTRVLFDLRSGIADAKVTLIGPPADVECNAPRADHGWDCPSQPPWNNVAPTVIRAGGVDWPCVWSHPIASRDLVIDLGERRLGDRVELEAALSDDAAATPNGAPVALRLEVEGVGEKVVTRSNAPGILRESIATTRGHAAHVRLHVTTTNDGRRHFGVNVRIVETPKNDPAPRGTQR